jgi:predicted pyridoxine 5'-phosphate oxidase superfamily flavin-nucleotide-binding protein
MEETLRLNGTAVLTTDPGVLSILDAGGKPPKLALGITVETVFLQCAKALKRSELWQPATWPVPGELPSAAEILRDHVGNGRSAEEVQRDLDVSYTERLW